MVKIKPVTYHRRFILNDFILHRLFCRMSLHNYFNVFEITLEF